MVAIIYQAEYTSPRRNLFSAEDFYIIFIIRRPRKYYDVIPHDNNRKQGRRDIIRQRIYYVR